MLLWEYLASYTDMMRTNQPWLSYKNTKNPLCDSQEKLWRISTIIYLLKIWLKNKILKNNTAIFLRKNSERWKNNLSRRWWHFNKFLEVATGGVLQEKEFLEISQNSQENIYARVSVLIKLQAREQLFYRAPLGDCF